MTDDYRLRRILTLAIVGAGLELALFFLAQRGPAFASIVHIVQVIAALAFAVAMWHASRRRGPGHDRRHGDRRDREGELPR